MDHSLVERGALAILRLHRDLANATEVELLEELRCALMAEEKMAIHGATTTGRFIDAHRQAQAVLDATLPKPQ